MRTLFSIILSAASLFAAGAQSGERSIIRIATDNTDLVLEVGPNKRVYQTYLGPKLMFESDMQNLSWSQHAGSDGSVSTRGWETYSTSGNEDFYEPALGITHADGNMTTYLYYVNSSQEKVPGGVHTRINLKDDKYPVNVTLNYVAYPKENVIKTWTEISHQEKKPITMSQYASAMLYFNEPQYWLTEFSSDWAKEAQMSSQQLQFGKKVIDTKLGSRAAMHTHAFFEVGLNGPVKEHSGEVLMGTLGWTGNFRFTLRLTTWATCVSSPASIPTPQSMSLRLMKYSLHLSSYSRSVMTEQATAVAIFMTGPANMNLRMAMEADSHF